MVEDEEEVEVLDVEIEVEPVVVLEQKVNDQQSQSADVDPTVGATELATPLVDFADGAGADGADAHALLLPSYVVDGSNVLHHGPQQFRFLGYKRTYERNFEQLLAALQGEANAVSETKKTKKFNFKAYFVFRDEQGQKLRRRPLFRSLMLRYGANTVRWVDSQSIADGNGYLSGKRANLTGVEEDRVALRTSYLLAAKQKKILSQARGEAEGEGEITGGAAAASTFTRLVSNDQFRDHQSWLGEYVRTHATIKFYPDRWTGERCGFEKKKGSARSESEDSKSKLALLAPTALRTSSRHDA